MRAELESSAEAIQARERAPLPVVWPEYFAENQSRAPATSPPAQRSMLLLAFAAVLGGATYLEHERLRNATTELFTLAASRVGDGWSRSEPPVATRSVVSAPAVVATEPEPTTGADPVHLEVEPVAETPVVADAPTPPEAPAAAAPERTAPVAAGKVEAQLRFAAPVVTVAESAAAARVVLERSGDTGSGETVVWWTTDGTASADEDYADLGERTETLGPGEVERALFVPLIQDAVSESAEQFYVHVGRYDQPRRHLALVSSVRVEIRGD